MNTKPTAQDLAKFLRSLRDEGRLTAADTAMLKAHAALPDRTAENWEIAEAAAAEMAAVLAREYTERQKQDVPHWKDVPSWHAVDVLQRWLGHALAQEFPYYLALIEDPKQIRQDGTKRWWIALAKKVKTVEGKTVGSKLHAEIADALNLL